MTHLYQIIECQILKIWDKKPTFTTKTRSLMKNGEKNVQLRITMMKKLGQQKDS